ncbi:MULTISPECIES: monovalent cation/H+ antiporter subunit D family protein [Salinibaculum]|uniref:monovalent cation/H+ antiporter subunit D family protein n=1 Tax=Salinibaculum TaxID=2732368 RepID=UPI0030CD09D3
MTDAIVLAIVVPIVAAVLTLLLGLRFDNVGWPMAVLATATQVGLTAVIGAAVLENGRVTYELAGFAPPAGIELVADTLSAPVALLVAVVSLAVLAYARTSGPHGNMFYIVYLLLVGGLAGVTLTGDLFNMYVFLEITGLAAYALVATGDTAKSAIAGLKYLVVGTIGASLFLLGVGYAFLATGTLNMADLAQRLGDVAAYDSRLVLASFALIVAGLAVKVALFPVHSWQPDAYQSSPDSVSIFISALVSTVAAYALGRILFSVFTPAFFDAVPMARTVLVHAAAVSILAGSTLAVLQQDVKRMLAYSSVAQFGMVVAAFAMMNELAAVGGVIHLVGHAIMKGGLFAAAGVIAAFTGARRIDDYAGLAGRAPVVAASFAVLAFAMVGVPPAVGFVGKWYIAFGAIESGTWVVAAVILASTLLTLAYFARIVERMYFRPAERTAAGDSAVGAATDGGEPPVSPGMVAVVVGAAVAAVVLGFFGSGIEAFLDPFLTEVFA